MIFIHEADMHSFFLPTVIFISTFVSFFVINDLPIPSFCIDQFIEDLEKGSFVS